MTELPTQLVRIVRETAPDMKFQTVQDADRPMSELGLDSLDKMFLLLAVQEQYSLELSESDIKSLRSLNDIAAILPA